MNKELCDLCYDMHIPEDLQRIPTHYIDDMGDQLGIEIEAFKNYYHICVKCFKKVKDTNNIRTEKYRKKLMGL